LSRTVTTPSISALLHLTNIVCVMLHSFKGGRDSQYFLGICFVERETKENFIMQNHIATSTLRKRTSKYQIEQISRCAAPGTAPLHGNWMVQRFTYTRSRFWCVSAELKLDVLREREVKESLERRLLDETRTRGELLVVPRDLITAK